VSLEIPNHIAIVMDGNGRWAQRRGYPRVYGHVRGCTRVREIVKEANDLGVKALTLYAFSTENWSRPEDERRVLWKLLKKYLVSQADELNRENVKLRVIGEVERLDEDIQSVVDSVKEKLSKNTGLQLTFAVSYGSRRELARAARLFAEDCLAGRKDPAIMDEIALEDYLWTSDMGNISEVDLFIRTSGEQRVSNFMLWQSAYAEFLFTEICWPEFRASHLKEAIQEYSKRERRFGGLGRTRPRPTGNGLDL
jgi:undecaprenyl diphosphate synthase